MLRFRNLYPMFEIVWLDIFINKGKFNEENFILHPDTFLNFKYKSCVLSMSTQETSGYCISSKPEFKNQ